MRWLVRAISSSRPRLVRREERPIAVADALEYGLETVVIRLLDGIEFVVVTAGAVHGQAHESLADRAEHVLQLLLADAGLDERADGAVAGLVPRPHGEEAGGDDPVRRAAGPARRRRSAP